MGKRTGEWEREQVNGKENRRMGKRTGEWEREQVNGKENR